MVQVAFNGTTIYAWQGSSQICQESQTEVSRYLNHICIHTQVSKFSLQVWEHFLHQNGKLQCRICE